MKSSQNIIDVILSVLPEASFDTDNYGQIIVYTNKMESENGEWVPFVESEQDSED